MLLRQVCARLLTWFSEGRLRLNHAIAIYNHLLLLLMRVEGRTPNYDLAVTYKHHVLLLACILNTHHVVGACLKTGFVDRVCKTVACVPEA